MIKSYKWTNIKFYGLIKFTCNYKLLLTFLFKLGVIFVSRFNASELKELEYYYHK